MCNQAAYAIVEFLARGCAVLKPHELKQLVASDEGAVQHSAQQGIIARLAECNGPFQVAHGHTSCCVVVSVNLAIHGRAASGSRTNLPNSLSIQPNAGSSNIASCRSPHSLN